MGSNFLSKVVLVSAVSGLLVSGVLPIGADAATKKVVKPVTKTVVAPYNYAKYRTDMARKITKLKSDITKRSRYFDGPVREVFDHDTYVEDTMITKSFNELTAMIVKYRAVMGTQYKTVTALSKTLSKVNTKTERLAFDSAYAKASSRYAEIKYSNAILVKGEQINEYIMVQQDKSIDLYRANQKLIATPYTDFLDVHPLMKAQVSKSVATNSKKFVDRKVLGGMKKVDAEKQAKMITDRIKYTHYVGYAYSDVRYDQLMEKVYSRDFAYINANRLSFVSLMPDALLKADAAVVKLFN